MNTVDAYCFVDPYPFVLEYFSLPIRFSECSSNWNQDPCLMATVDGPETHTGT